MGSGLTRALIVKFIIGSLPTILFFVAIFAAALILLEIIKIDFSDKKETVICTESGFVINKTSLTKTQFVESVTNFTSSSGIDSVFSVNAGQIYDKAVEKSINPELVVVRAYAESECLETKTTGGYNYWGIGCTNTGGGADCEKFDSFLAGVDRFLEIVSQYSSLSDMMAKYSYIGEYWYNPGSDNDGGCYYKDYIYPDGVPSRVQNACERECSVANTTNCVATTEDDQKAYMEWQVKTNMGGIRKTIFGLDTGEGIVCTGNNGSLVELTDYPLGHEGLTVVNSPLSEDIINEVNVYIKDMVNKSGYGTGAGVAAAGQSLIYGLRQKGYYLPYYWGGGQNDGAFTIGISSYLGTYGASEESSGGNVYYYHSYDCSGFVSWAIKNGCKSDFHARTTSSYISNEYGPPISLSEAKPGDIMVYRTEKGGHIRLVVKNNGDGTIITAESHSSGVDFTKQTSMGIYTIHDMTDWYAKNCTVNA